MLEKIVKNVEELNAAAMHLLLVKDLESLKKLAKEWSIPYQQTEDYIHGKRYRLAQIPVKDKDYRTAAEKLRDEMILLNDKVFADVIAWYILQKAADDEELSVQILKKHKSLQRCLDHVTGKAYEMAQEQRKQKGLDKIPQNMGIALTEKEVFPWAEEYYRKQDEEEIEKQEAERKTKIRTEWERLENKTTVVPKKTTASPKRKKAAATKEETTAKTDTVKATNKKETTQQMSLFDLQ